MTFEDYYISPVAETSIPHEVIVNGLKVECNMLGCDYSEYFPTYDDAKIGAEVHGRLSV